MISFNGILRRIIMIDGSVFYIFISRCEVMIIIICINFECIKRISLQRRSVK